MPTPNENKALLFLATIACLGASVRVWRVYAEPVPATAASQPALDRQLQAVDSATTAKRSKTAKRKLAMKKTRHGAAVKVGAGSTVLPGMPSMTAAGTGSGAGAYAGQGAAGPKPVDIDTADSLTLRSLPGVGAKLSGRILADRRANGAFGGMEALRRVRGISAKLSTALDSLVTFSGPRRPLNTVLSGGSAPGDTSVRRGRRRTP